MANSYLIEVPKSNYDGRVITIPDLTKSEVLNTGIAETYFDDRYMETIPSPSGNGLRVVKSIDEEGARTSIGLVNIDNDPNADSYQKWLKDNYGLEFDTFDHSKVIPPNSP